MQAIKQLLSNEQLALLPTETDIAFYEKHGWYISKPGVDFCLNYPLNNFWNNIAKITVMNL